MDIIVNNIKDKYKLKKWLEIASENMTDKEDVNMCISRLEREISFFNNFNPGWSRPKKEIKPFEVTDHSKAVEWMVKTHKYLDDEALAFGKDSDYGNIKDELVKFQDMFIDYVHKYAEDIDEHEFYNDEVDEWYFQRRGTDKQDIRGEYLFPTEVFVFKYQDYFWYYSEMSGQGTAFGLSVMTEEDIIGFLKDYGITRDLFEHKVYKIG